MNSSLHCAFGLVGTTQPAWATGNVDAVAVNHDVRHCVGGSLEVVCDGGVRACVLLADSRLVDAVANIVDIVGSVDVAATVAI
jgi:hypothetical protein